jgi:hypothetical protein
MIKSNFYEAVMVGSIKNTYTVDSVLKSHGIKGSLTFVIGDFIGD